MSPRIKRECANCGIKLEKREGYFVNFDRTKLYCEWCSLKKMER